MISKDKITEIFCSIDDFFLFFESALEKVLFLPIKRPEIENSRCQKVKL